MGAVNLTFGAVALLLEEHLGQQLALAGTMTLPKAGLPEGGHLGDLRCRHNALPDQLAGPQPPVRQSAL